MWKLVEGAVEATSTPTAMPRSTRPFARRAARRIGRRATTRSLPSPAEAGYTKSWMRRVESHVPNGQVPAASGKNWLAELRVASIVLAQILSINNDTPDVLNKTQHVCCMHAALVKYRG